MISIIYVSQRDWHTVIYCFSDNIVQFWNKKSTVTYVSFTAKTTIFLDKCFLHLEF